MGDLVGQISSIHGDLHEATHLNHQQIPNHQDGDPILQARVAKRAPFEPGPLASLGMTQTLS